MRHPSILLSLITFFLFTNAYRSLAQCPVADFTVQTLLCSGDQLQLTNLSSNASDYFWDFTPSFDSMTATLNSDTTLNLSYPGDLASAIQNDTLFLFIAGRNDGNLYRLTYGNGFDQQPSLIENLGAIFSTLVIPTDLKIYQEGGNWYGLVVDGYANSLVRVDFGNDIKNIPLSATTVLSNLTSGMSEPRSIDLTRDSIGNIFGVVSNYTSASISILSFGNSILNTPATANYPILNSAAALDAKAVHTCGQWFVFIAATSTGSIVRADFGNSLNNTPVMSTVYSGGQPTEITIFQDNGEWIMLTTNFDNNWIRHLNFGTDITNSAPVLSGNDNFGGAAPKGIVTINNGFDRYAYVLFMVSFNVQTIKYTHAVSSNLAYSTDFQPANIVFQNGGTHTISLTVFDNSGTSHTKNVTVTVLPKITASFSFTNHCLGDLTLFTDSTTVESGSITSWVWDFGDGNTSSQQNPTHTYGSTGVYTTTLTTTSDAGCMSVDSAQILISNIPSALFNATAGCSATPISFTDQSTISGGGNLSGWFWDFGNGDTSGIQSPTYSFPAGGNFQVSLTVTSDSGCSDSFSMVLPIIDRPTANFLPDNTCVGQTVQFTDLSTVSGASIISYTWNFGDGNNSALSNPSHMYSGGVASYDVELIITASNGCIDTITQQVKINNIPSSSFSFTGGIICSGSSIQFTDGSTVLNDTVSGWLWDFGDGQTDTSFNPSHIYQSPGTYNVTLIAYSPTSCPGAPSNQSVTVTESPLALFTSTNTCFGSVTQFTDNSIPPAGGTLTNWNWHFNVNDSASTTNTSFQFASPGTYPVTLVVTASNTCQDVDTVLVTIHPQPTASFIHTPGCDDQDVQFTNTSISDTGSVISSYQWDFGDLNSGSDNYSTFQNPTHLFDTALTFYVSLITTTNFGCADTTAQLLNVKPSPPAQFTYSATCYGNLMSFFNPGSSIDSAYFWNFGDNQYNFLREPAHYYNSPGNYIVVLTVYGSNGCSATASRQVSVSPIPVANFSTPPACDDVPYQFTDNSTIASGSIVNWEWKQSGSLFDSIQNPYYTFSDTGLYQISLTVTSDIGCINSATRTLHVYPAPFANFVFDPQFGNPPLDVTFSNLSTGANQYQWIFGDGDTSSLINPFHSYQDTGIFEISLIVTTTYGCSDTATKNIYVIKPVLDIAVEGDSSYFSGDNFYIVTKLVNLGTREINHVDVEARLEDGSIIRESIDQLIPNGPAGKLSYRFNASFLAKPGYSYKYYCVRAISPNFENDDVPSNNEKCFNRTDKLILVNPYPSPFYSTVNIRVIVPFDEELSIDLYDQAGKLVMNAFEGMAEKGLNDFPVDGSRLSDGLYTIAVRFQGELYHGTAIKAEPQK
jgi:PKD repeat protein